MAPVELPRLESRRVESEINVNAKVCHAARMLIKANQAMIKLYVYVCVDKSRSHKRNSKQKANKANKLANFSSTSST